MENQEAFHDDPSKWRLASGPVGSGKSVAATIEAVKHSYFYPNNYGFITRKTQPEINISALKDFKDACPKWMMFEENKQQHWIDIINKVGFQKCGAKIAKGKLTKKKARALLESVGGLSRVEFISFEATEKASKKFRSANLGWYMVEQAEEGNTDLYDNLNERLRREPAGRQAWFVANPHGHDWLWHRFHPDSMHRLQDHGFHFFKENRHLPSDFYPSLRLTMSKTKFAQMVEGSYDVAPNAVYPEFSHKIHVLPAHHYPDADCIKGVGVDHGLHNPTAAIFVAALPDNIYYIYQEYYAENRLISENAAAIRQYVTPEHRARFIDPMSGRNRMANTGVTVVDEYARNGLVLNLGESDVGAGIDAIKKLLRVDPEKENPFTKRKGCPGLLVSPNCPNFIREMGLYRWEMVKTDIGHSNEPEKPHKYMDHTCDASRFVIPEMMTSHYAEPYTPPKVLINTSKIKKHENIIVDSDGEIRYNIGKLIREADKVVRHNNTSWIG